MPSTAYQLSPRPISNCSAQLGFYSGNRLLLDLNQDLNSPLGQRKKFIHLGPAKRLALCSSLHLDETTIASADYIHVHFCTRNFIVLKIKQRHVSDNTN